MTLEEALAQLAGELNIDATDLIAYAAEDTIGGRDTGSFPPMSTFAAEGQVLYALIRALKPQQVVEVGVDSGGTSTHILSALKANGTGKLWSVDIKEQVGQNVPDDLRSLWTLVAGQDALSVKLPEHVDFCFEDGPHDYDFTFRILIRLRALTPRIILSHDMFTGRIYGGFDVEQAFADALGVSTGLLIEPSFCGLGYWINDNA